MGVRGTIVMILATVINSELLDSGSGERRINQGLSRSLRALVRTGGPDECGRGNPPPSQCVG